MTRETADNPVIRLPWAGKSVRIEQVEEELSFLWRLSADNMRTGQNTNVRTSVLNFVICAPDIASARRASGLLRDLSSTHIARAAVVILDRSNSAAALSTWITLRCFSVISDLMRHCFEQATVMASGGAVRSIANIIHPLLKPDLPVYLWWLGDPSENDTTFNNLIEISSRVMVDSATFAHPEQELLTLEQVRQATPDCALSDLNWERITMWRQLIIQFFDSSEYRPYLEGVNAIEIEYAAGALESEAGPANPSCALLLAGWLKDRLGWSLTKKSGHHQRDTANDAYHWEMKQTGNARSTRKLPATRATTGKLAQLHSPSAAPTITIRRQLQAEIPPGSICLVRLTSTYEGKQAVFTLRRDGDPEHVFTSVEQADETSPPRTVSLTSAQKDNELLQAELEITGHDLAFEQTLYEVAELLR